MDSQTLHPSAYPVAPIANALNRDADKIVIETVGGKAWTGGEMRDAISCYMQALASRDIGAGTRVGLLAPNSVEVLVLHNVFTLAGLVLVPLHPMGSVDDHCFAIEDGSVEALIYDPVQFGPHVREIRRRSNILKNTYSLGEDDQGDADLVSLGQEFEVRPLESASIAPETITRISYSGGTTGKPKAIPGNVRVSQAALQIMLADWEWPNEPRMLVVVPLSHAGGSLFAPVILKHGTLVVLPRFEPQAVLKAIQDYKINSIMLVPTMIYALLDCESFDDYDLSSLETIFYGASLMSPVRLQEGIRRIGPVFFQFYGQAEAPMTLCTLRRSDHDPDNLERLASCGRPVPYVTVELLDDENNPVPQGEPGEICVRGPLVMDGYLNRDELNAETFDGGWLHTGDVAVKDPDGFLRIVDRKKDMIVSGGFNVFPSEVENTLTDHAAVSQACVFGIPDERWGESVVAAIVLRPGMKADADELIELAKDKKGSVNAPKHVYFVENIPQTAVGKPDKKALRAIYSQPGT